MKVDKFKGKVLKRHLAFLHLTIIQLNFFKCYDIINYKFKGRNAKLFIKYILNLANKNYGRKYKKIKKR